MLLPSSILQYCEMQLHFLLPLYLNFPFAVCFYFIVQLVLQNRQEGYLNRMQLLSKTITSIARLLWVVKSCKSYQTGHLDLDFLCCYAHLLMKLQIMQMGHCIIVLVAVVNKIEAIMP